MDDFVDTFSYKMITMLEGYDIEYQIRKSLTTRSIYFIFMLGSAKIKVRISDHRPYSRSYTYSLHPRGKHSIQLIRTRIKRFFSRKKKRGKNKN